jgi:hypothetical protein
MFVSCAELCAAAVDGLGVVPIWVGHVSADSRFLPDAPDLPRGLGQGQGAQGVISRCRPKRRELNAVSRR